jgi:hypothetical protein
LVITNWESDPAVTTVPPMVVLMAVLKREEVIKMNLPKREEDFLNSLTI